MSRVPQSVRFPQYYDSPPQILWFEGDDLLPLLFGIFVGLVLKNMTDSLWYFLIGVGFGLYMMKVYIKSKQNKLTGNASYYLYRHSFGLYKLNKIFKNGMLRRYVN